MQSDSIEGFLSSRYHSLDQKKKESILLPLLGKMAQSYCVASSKYVWIVNAKYSKTQSSYRSLIKNPFLSVRFFKEYKFSSISDEEIKKILRSSGTASKIFLKIFLAKIKFIT